MRLEIKSILNPTLSEIPPTQLHSKNPNIENPDLPAKPQVWRHWPIHYESTKKVTQLIEQVNVM